MYKNTNTTIAIIGAGAAGLTAAATLKRQGYTNITLFEKEAQAGGKCRSIEYEGRSYELGAGIVASSNHTIMELIEETGTPIETARFGQNNIYDLAQGKVCDAMFNQFQQASFLWQLLLRYRRLSWQYNELDIPGLAHINPELYHSFAIFAERHNIPLVYQYFERFFTGFGYGYWTDIPAAYTLKYNNWATLASYLRREIYTFSNGIQSFWQTIAKSHTIHYNSTIRKIIRTTTGITITTDQSEQPFDKLIIACPLDNTLSFLDASDEEQDLFSQIQYIDYQTYACTLENFVPGTGFISAHFNANKKGHPVFWYKRYPDSNFYTFYVISDFSLPESVIRSNIATAVAQLGGKIIKYHHVVKWRYFPHVSTEVMQGGYYERLEALQSVRNTYYVGELFNFSMVELTAAYAKQLVTKYF